MITINSFKGVKSESTIYKTSPEQRIVIEEAIVQISKGVSFTNEQVEMEIDKWLKEN